MKPEGDEQQQNSQIHFLLSHRPPPAVTHTRGDTPSSEADRYETRSEINAGGEDDLFTERHQTIQHVFQCVTVFLQPNHCATVVFHLSQMCFFHLKLTELEVVHLRPLNVVHYKAQTGLDLCYLSQ